MTTSGDNEEQAKQSEQDELTQMLTTALGPVVPPLDRCAALRGRLTARVAASAERHAGLRTVRKKDAQWRPLRDGVRYQLLWSGSQGQSVLIEMAPGASLPTHRHRWVEEGIVLRGGLQMGELDLGRFDYHLSPPGSRHATIRSRQGALAFLRGTSLGDTGGVLREVLGGLLPFSGPEPLTVFHAEQSGWIAIAPGVDRKDVWTDGERMSSFYRLRKGVTCPAHVHACEEECLMLEGEVFFGDLLVQAGEYHFAPEGSSHGEVTSDVGALFFVRSAVDPIPAVTV